MFSSFLVVKQRHFLHKPALEAKQTEKEEKMLTTKGRFLPRSHKMPTLQAPVQEVTAAREDVQTRSCHIILINVVE